jgi:phosphatidylethanolamine-binding protein (PEBP) family uncharacterized protein
VAQRTGAKRFLAPPAKSASAGASLALALAALLLSGCGGGSSDPQAQSTTDTAAKSDVAAQKGQGADSAKAGAHQDAAKSKAGGAEHDPAAGDPAGQKHGPRIAQPKGAREKAPTKAEKASATVADMSLQSPVLTSVEGQPASLPATYTCDGKDSWPALRWSGVPADSAELILYAMNLAPVEGHLFIDWAVGGIDPGLTSLQAGQLPKGVVVGTNSFGKHDYEICPASGAETYVFALFALPRSLSPKPGFEPHALREEILDVSRNVGLLPFAYARG